MRKVFTIVFATLIMCCLFSIITSAVDINGVDYTLTESNSGNTATVSIANKKMTTKDVVIPQTVTYEGKTYTVTTVVRQAFEANTSIETLVIEADLGATGLKGYAFSQCSNLKQVTLPSSLTVIPERCFKQCTSLTEFILPSNLQEIGSCAFWKCTGLLSIDIPASVTVISDKVFEECTALKTVRSAAPVIGERMFYNCKAVESATFTNTVSVGSLAFYYFGIKNGEGVLVLPDTLTTVSSKAFQYCYFNTVILPKSITNVAENGFINFKNYCKTIKFTGTEAQANELFSSYEISYELVNHCEVYYNSIHVEDNNPCVINCTRCNILGVAEENPVHSMVSDVKYSSYAENGLHIGSCTNKGCTHTVTEEMPALFTCRGYSVPENGDGGITLGYVVNYDAIEYYEQLTGKAVSFGVFAVLKDRLGSNDIFDAEGKTADGVISADLSASKFTVFQLKIVGFKDEQKDIKLAMGAYVAVTDGETTEYSYMQGGEPNENEKYCFVSYNDIVGTPSTNE
ncbi:MAG: leucine-rich repeat domain-containing protein [Clostridia bacterium]|nr:leucine-rich repeat domain-containing protein [Clostridia bacterium]